MDDDGSAGSIRSCTSPRSSRSSCGRPTADRRARLGLERASSCWLVGSAGDCFCGVGGPRAWTRRVLFSDAAPAVPSIDVSGERCAIRSGTDRISVRSRARRAPDSALAADRAPTDYCSCDGPHFFSDSLVCADARRTAPRRSAAGTRALFSSRPSCWWVTNEISARTLGIAAPMSTTNGACFTPRSRTLLVARRQPLDHRALHHRRRNRATRRSCC